MRARGTMRLTLSGGNFGDGCQVGTALHIISSFNSCSDLKFCRLSKSTYCTYVIASHTLNISALKRCSHHFRHCLSVCNRGDTYVSRLAPNEDTLLIPYFILGITYTLQNRRSEFLTEKKVFCCI